MYSESLINQYSNHFQILNNVKLRVVGSSLNSFRKLMTSNDFAYVTKNSLV